MLSKIVYTVPGAKPHTTELTLLAGLEWRVLSAATEAALREMAQERSASHAVRVRLRRTESTSPPAPPSRALLARLTRKPAAAQEREVAGFFVSLDGSAPPPKSHSIAAAFAGWMANHPSALLCYALSSELMPSATSFSGATGWVVVVVMAGMPVVDTVVASWDEAHALVAPFMEAHPGISMVSNDAVRYPQTIKADNILPALAHFAQTEGKTSTRLVPIPGDITRLVVLTLVVVLAVCAYLYYQKAEQEAARKRAIAERAEKDPATLYLTALRAQSPGLGVTRQGLLDAYRQLSRLPLAVKGWELQTAQCTTTCSANYIRIWGTTAELAAALQQLGQGFALEPHSVQDTDLDRAVVTLGTPLAPQGPDTLPITHQAFMQGLAANQFQRWKTAGLGVQIKAPQLWPQVPGVPTTFKSAQAIAVGQFEVNAIALPLLQEVLAQAPESVVWQGLSMRFSKSSGDNPLEAGKANATGVFYVRPQ